MRGSFDTSHLRKGEDVGHASANPGIQGTTEIGLPVRAQESKADARLRPGREGDERVEVGVEGTAQGVQGLARRRGPHAPLSGQPAPKLKQGRQVLRRAQDVPVEQNTKKEKEERTHNGKILPYIRSLFKAILSAGKDASG